MKQFYYRMFSNSCQAFFLTLCFLILQSMPCQAQKLSKTPDETGGQYIVVYKDKSKAAARMSTTSAVALRRQMMEQEVTATLVKNKIIAKQVTQVYETVIKGFAISSLTEAELSVLRKDDQVDYIVPDTPVYLSVDGAAKPLPLAGSCAGPSVIFNGVSNYAVGLASFGSTAVVTGQVVQASDASATPTLGCGAIVTDVSGKIALIDRGVCNFSLKAYNAQLAGAIGVIIVNNVPGDATSLGTGANAELVTIPVLCISQDAGTQLKTTLINGTVVNATLDPGPIDPASQCTPWGIARVNGGLSGAGKRVWIIDSGVDSDHPDLNVDTNLWTSFVPGLTSPEDVFGHGTHVAGTIAALDNGIGVIGVAAGAKVIAVRVFGTTGTSSNSVILAGMNYVTANAISSDVVNMSLGGDANRAFDKAVLAMSKVCKVVVAAGNDSRDANYNSPARLNAPNVYTVSATDLNDKLATFSNYGNAPVDYAAPGVNVLSCWLNGGYAYSSGTSMAAPHVAGLLLLGDICSASSATSDPDGRPDPIAMHVDPAFAADSDGDHYTVCQGDPDDNDATVYPGAPEICGDGKDNNGNGVIDDGCCPAGNNGTLYVKANAAGAGTGVSWENAFTSLQSALSAARKCSQITQIWVAKGTYYPTADQFGQTTPADPLTKTFVLQNDLTIYGGFAGNEGTGFDLSQRDFTNNKTTLSGELIQNNTVINNVYHVFLNIPVYPHILNPSAVLDGFTIYGGEATMLVAGFYSFPNSYGGGMINYNASPTITNCSFESNIGNFGGAISNDGSSPMIAKTAFLTNRSINGGGIYGDNSSNPIIANSLFYGNSALQAGGGIFTLNSSNPIITNSSFQLNTAIQGGGIENIGSSTTITNSSFSANSATQSGGSIDASVATYAIKNSIFWGNTPELSNQAGITISYSIIQGGWTGTGNNNLNTDPRFVSQPVIGQTTPGNLSLADCSPAINAADPATTPATVGTTDLAGNARVYGAAIDMGAYEVQSVSVFNPMISATPGLGIAPGESTTLTASGADSYLWSTSETTANIVVSPATTTTYTVTTTTGSCSKMVATTVTVGALPVRLISFSAKKQANGSVQLAWVTSNEVNNAFFKLERSIDLVQVESLAKVISAEQSGQTNSYGYTDERPHHGTSYYRLRQVDLDGQETAYAWVSIVMDQVYIVFPNPVVANKLQLTLDEPSTAILKFYSVDGKQLPLQVTGRGAGVLDLKLPKSASAGIYLLQVVERGQSRQYRIVVQ